MKFRVVLEFDPETGSYSAVCSELPWLRFGRDTEEEVRENIQEAIKLYLEPSELDLPETLSWPRSRLGERGTPRLTSDQVAAILNRNGFLKVGQSGSHQKWRKRSTGD